MPEFIMKGLHEAQMIETDFVRGYIEALFFTNEASGVTSDEWHTPEVQEGLREGTIGGALPCDVGYMDLHPDTLEMIRVDCRDFQDLMRSYLQQAYERGYTEEQAGHDFWFTRNGHGVGFWCRDELEEGDLGNILAGACGWGNEFVEVYPWFADHVDHGDAPYVYCE